MDFEKKLQKLKGSLARQSLDTYMTVEGEVEQKGTPKENLFEYIDGIKSHYQEMINHAEEMPDDIQNGGLAHMILSKEFMEEVRELEEKVHAL